MARYFVRISKEDFEKKLVAAAANECTSDTVETLDALYEHEDFYDSAFRNIVTDDMKVEFDCENMMYKPEDVGDDNMKGMVGLQRLPNGMDFFGVCAGGDWEAPVFFILYWDGKKIRGYIPTEGNTFNKKTKQAYGNGEDDAGYGPDFDPAALMTDITARITAKPVRQPYSGPPKAVTDLTHKNKFTPDEVWKIVTQAIMEEYEHAWSLIEDSPCQVTKLRASGHAQCAVSILAKLGLNSEQMASMHMKMASLFEQAVKEEKTVM
jgi:hypothetical protein